MSCPSENKKLSEFEMVMMTGEEYMLRQLAEECTELAQACLKKVRAGKGETPMSEKEATDNMLEEMADVQVMFRIFERAILTPYQLQEISDIRGEKYRRMSDRLRGNA